MLVVISDTHFAGSLSNQLGGKAFNNNLPALVFHNYFQELSIIAQQQKIQKIDLVLAGDIFEITRSALWLKDDLRPYININAVKEGSRLEKRVLDILDAIENDSIVCQILSLFRNISGVIGIEVKIHFVPGNHDRLLNCTPAIRRRARVMLGMLQSDEKFSNIYLHPKDDHPNVLVRHGHEYDPVNFGMDIHGMEAFPVYLPIKAYEDANVGDFFTVDIATRLPIEFKKIYSLEQIAFDEKLGLIYERLIEFDNVRPASALLNFLLTTPGVTKKESWRILEPVVIQILNSWAQNRNLSLLINDIPKKHTKIGYLIGWFVGSGITIKNIPFWVINIFIRLFSKRVKMSSQVVLIRKEEVFSDHSTAIHCLVMGHTHVPEVKLIAVEDGIEKYYINTGAWRKMVPATPDLSNFGHLRTLTKAIIFDENEHNVEYGDQSGWSFDFNSEVGYGYELGKI